MFIKHKKRNFFHVWSNDTRNGMILTQAQYSPLYQSIWCQSFLSNYLPYLIAFH